MRSLIITIIGALLSTSFLFSQENYQLSGKISDDHGHIMPGATVVAKPGNHHAVSDLNGRYKLIFQNKGEYIISTHYVGYEENVDTIFIDSDSTYNIYLHESHMTLHEVVVSDNYAESINQEESLVVDVVNDEYLRQNLGGSLMTSLERLPGVSTITIGSGQSKPVIRGLGFNRVVVVENDVVHEGQQWGVDHGLEIDQYAVENLDVIKGPASLAYGSDAIGGVVKIKPTPVPEPNTINASISLTGKSNNYLGAVSANFIARKTKLYTRLQGSLVDYADFKVPVDHVDVYDFKVYLYKHNMRNTAGRERNFHLTFGYIDDKFHNRLMVSYVSSKTGFFANAHGLEPLSVDTAFYDKSSRDIDYPFQDVRHTKVVNNSKLQFERLVLESDIGYQNNFRQEWSQYIDHGYMPPVFPDTLPFSSDLERQFNKDIFSVNLKGTYMFSELTNITSGINFEYQENDITGRGFIIPAFNQSTVGAYIHAKHFLSEKSIIQAGIRYDFGHIYTYSYFDWYQSPVIEGTDTTWVYLQRAPDLRRSFSNFIWSLGYNYNSGSYSGKVNIGKSFRMPIAKELAANGVNYHMFSFDVGDPNLDPEVSYQIDISSDYHKGKFAIGVNLFTTYFHNYIYLNPSYEHDRLYGNGNQIFYYTQSKVFRYGGEIHTHYELIDHLTLGLIGEYVYSRQLSGEKTGFTLPFSPPASMLFNIKYRKPKIWVIEKGYFTFDYRLTFAQNNVVPPEDPTPGSNVFNIGFGGKVRVNNNQINFAFQIRNLFNTAYFNHTSYYRLINVPEPGRNIILNIIIPIKS